VIVWRGVRTDGGDEGPLFSQRCERRVEALQYFAASPLLFEPGTQYRYSSYGWIIVSAAVEAAAFLEFMRERIFDPLEMRDTRADSAMNPIPNRVTFYFPRFASDPTYGLHLMRDLDYSCYAGASAPHSDWPRARRRVTVLAETSRPSRWRVNKRVCSATMASRWAGWWRLS
jgi:CubicO group peptidase (beta-lactamase class C family)